MIDELRHLQAARLGNPLAIYGATRGGFGAALRTAATL